MIGPETAEGVEDPDDGILGDVLGVLAITAPLKRKDESGVAAVPGELVESRIVTRLGESDRSGGPVVPAG